VSFGKLEIRYPDGRQVTVDLLKRQMAIGRASDVDIPISDGQVSRRHAYLLCGPEGVRLVDLGSANGTFMGPNRLPAQQPIPLADGAVVRVGQTIMRFSAAKGEVVTPAEPPAPSAPAAPTSLLRPETDTAIKPPAPAAPPAGAPPAASIPAFTPPPAPPPPAAEEPAQPAQPASAPSTAKGYSTYLKYLPPIYSDDDFMGRFLLIFETILSPIERTVGNLHYYFDAEMTPPELLPWLASWLGLALDERWPDDQRRALILAAVELYQWRGTRRGLSEFLRLYTGLTPEIVELGVGRRGATAADAFRFTVRLKVPDPSKVDRAVVEAIIEAEKPAHTGYSLEIVAG
jgi:phage tail-like protein